MESLNKPWNIPSIQVLLGENATIKTNQKQGNVKAQVQLDISCAEFGSFFNMHSKWRLISRLIPILFQNTKGNLAFKLPSSPKWWFSPFTLIPWEHQHTFNYSFTPDDCSAPLCKLSQEITYCTALCLYTSHSSWRAEAALWGCPCSPACAHSGTVPALTLERSLWKIQTGADSVSLLPSRGHAMATVTGTFIKIHGFAWERFGLALNLDCFISSKIVAFTKTIGVFMWRERGDVSRS